MIKNRVIVSRYAEAFIKYAQGTIGVTRAATDIKGIRDLMREHQDFKEYLESPEIPFVDQRRMIDQVLGEDFSRETKQFLELLIQNRRINLFWDISEYIRLTCCHEGEESVLLKTTFLLDLDLVQRIKDKVEEKLQKKIKFYIELDSRLLGGIQIVMGNKIIDGSIRGQLFKLKEQLMTAGVN